MSTNERYVVPPSEISYNFTASSFAPDSMIDLSYNVIDEASYAPSLSNCQLVSTNLRMLYPHGVKRQSVSKERRAHSSGGHPGLTHDTPSQGESSHASPSEAGLLPCSKYPIDLNLATGKDVQGESTVGKSAEKAPQPPSSGRAKVNGAICLPGHVSHAHAESSPEKSFQSNDPEKISSPVVSLNPSLSTIEQFKKLDAVPSAISLPVKAHEHVYNPFGSASATTDHRRTLQDLPQERDRCDDRANINKGSPSGVCLTLPGTMQMKSDTPESYLSPTCHHSGLSLDASPVANPTFLTQLASKQPRRNMVIMLPGTGL